MLPVRGRRPSGEAPPSARRAGHGVRPARGGPPRLASGAATSPETAPDGHAQGAMGGSVFSRPANLTLEKCLSSSLPIVPFR